MTKAKWGMVAIGVCGAWWAIATARVAAEGLAGLDAQLNETGRIGVYTPPATHIAPGAPDGGNPKAGVTRDPEPVQARIDDAAERARHPADGGTLVQPTDSAVAACRVEVARRRRVPPSMIAATTVVLRFTIEPNGRVHNAEALSAPGTDLDVAACAKRVLSEWVFPKRLKDATQVERTYRFVTSASR
jgi:hypothetical protein